MWLLYKFLKIPNDDYKCVFVCFSPPAPNFAMLLKWQSSIIVFSQIWRYSKYESRKILSTISGNCGKIWRLFFFPIKKHDLVVAAVVGAAAGLSAPGSAHQRE